MIWTALKRTIDLLTFALLVLMLIVILTNSKSSEDIGNFGLKLDIAKQESLNAIKNNVEYFEKRINSVAEKQDSYQVSTDQRVYVLEMRMKELQADKKNNQKIINNNNSNAVIYSGKEQ
jgi:ribose 5-phosphate isomerase